MKKLNLGIIGTGWPGQMHAEAIRSGKLANIRAAADLNEERLSAFIEQYQPAKCHGDYHGLLHDPEIDAVIICLPNFLHFPASLAALENGKHVLCEKPISLTVEEAIPLLSVRDRTGVLIEEAFMVRTNPQWVSVLEMIRDGKIGEVRSLTGYFSYNNQDPNNIRNILEFGGGALMDIGCYLMGLLL